MLLQGRFVPDAQQEEQQHKHRLTFVGVARPGGRGLFQAAPRQLPRQVLLTVRMRCLSTGFLVGSLLFCSWGNVLAAAFCPRFALANVSVARHLAHRPASHARTCGMEMGDMQMDGMDEPATNENTRDLQIDFAAESTNDSNALDRPPGLCIHCSMHSQAASGPVSVGAIHSEKESADTKSSGFGFVSLPPVTVTSDRPTAHAPPGDLPSRYVLINVFRI